MSCLLIQIACLSLVVSAVALPTALAEDKADKKEENKPQPPRVLVALPLAIKTGATNKVTLRGENLTNVAELRFTNPAVKAQIVLQAKTKAAVPKDADAKKIGDTQVIAEIILTADAPVGTNWFVVASPDGLSEPKPLRFLPAGQLDEEQEPNGGFREAQALVFGVTICGTIKETGDVDVFRFQGAAGQIIRGEISAASAASALDSLLTLYDAKGHLLASNDDARGGRDSYLEFRLATAGIHYLSVMDANDKAGPTHAYLLRVVRVSGP